jgi:hypothetical protein
MEFVEEKLKPAETEKQYDNPARALAKDLLRAIEERDEEGVVDSIMAIWESARETKDGLTSDDH